MSQPWYLYWPREQRIGAEAAGRSLVHVNVDKQTEHIMLITERTASVELQAADVMAI